MSIEVKVPQLPESVADATLVAWHKKAGDTVRREENLVDLETDKVVLEVPAPVYGVIKQIVAADGAVVTSGQLLAILEPGAVAATAASPAAAATVAKSATTAAPLKAVAQPEAMPEPARASDPAPAAAAMRSSASASMLGKSARSFCSRASISFLSIIVSSSGPGRIERRDLLGCD